MCVCFQCNEITFNRRKDKFGILRVYNMQMLHDTFYEDGENVQGHRIQYLYIMAYA